MTLKGTLEVGVTVVASCDAGAAAGLCGGAIGRQDLSSASAQPADEAPVAVAVGTDGQSGARIVTVAY